ncbi:neuroligin-4, X-linked-like [Babylonia areolata]|uniref:neuroligin-4, X-linked-like n=1 Tax=Babylonia areolata TaxID=304850 RepID=UPI003FD4B2DC
MTNRLRSSWRMTSRGRGDPTTPLILLLTTLMPLLLLLPQGASAIVYRKQMSSRVITTRYGKVRGILVEFPNRHLKPVEAFFGLKYADLEKGNMRFMPPKNPKEQWTKIRAAIQQRPPCPQQPHEQHEKHAQHVPSEGRAAHLRNITPFLSEQQEDCLTLNLYVPVPKWNETTPLPVMVFIHGETYDSGTGNAYDGSVLSSFGDVIVVTLNYRLGVLGFLTTMDHSAMGNLGLLDIAQALLWLQDNIASFSGDPRRVTLFGHGHGASLVNLLLLSPFVSEGRGPFFQQAILQSGSALSSWAVSYDPLWCTEKLAISVNCSSHLGHSEPLVSCLRHRSFTELLNAAPEAPKYYSCFAPAVDEWTVLPTQVEKLIKERKSKFSSVPVMLGITKNEAYSYLKPQEIHKGISDLRKTQILRTYVQNLYRYHRQKIYEILDHQYTDWTQPSNKITNRDNILEMLSDGQYVAPLIQTANYHSETADTYLYAFSYSTQAESSSAEESEGLQGIHGDELPYVFGSPLVDGLSPFPSSYTSVEKMLSEAVMTFWTNFAKSGNPNFPRNQTSLHGGKTHNRFAGLTWPKYDKSDQEYLQISRRPAVRHHYRGQKLALWLDLLPKINKADGAGPSSHQLSTPTNRSTFDDYHRLIPPFDNLFPSPPPMPPLAPNQGGGEGVEGGQKKEGEEREETRKKIAASSGESGTTSSLSITVAVGTTLLFLNLLVFAAVYYQRRRIRKLRERGTESRPSDLQDLQEVKLTPKEPEPEDDNTGKRPYGGGGGDREDLAPETDSLMSADSAEAKQRTRASTKSSTRAAAVLVAAAVLAT